jgi:hypothetical protein
MTLGNRYFIYRNPLYAHLFQVKNTLKCDEPRILPFSNGFSFVVLKLYNPSGPPFHVLLDEAATRRKNISKQCITPIAA